MDRNFRRDDRRRREDTRTHKPRYGMEGNESTNSNKSRLTYRDRSRSPIRRDRRDDHRRDRSPRRDPPTGPRSDRENGSVRSRNPVAGGTVRIPNDRQQQQQPKESNDGRPSGTVIKSGTQSRGRAMSDVPMNEVLEDEDSEAEMQRMMGFKDFRTTKDTKVPGNDKNHAIYKVKKSEYRQYMNRTGGFNRPLSPSRE